MNENVYHELISTALPEAQVLFRPDYDQAFYTWDISPKPGSMLRVKVEIESPNILFIESYLIEAFGASYTTVFKRIFVGWVPKKEDDPNTYDYAFIRQILRNWMCF